MSNSEDIKVEIILPEEYVRQSMATMSKYSDAIAYLCKAGAILEEDETEFLIWGINVLQTQSIEEIFRKFGVEMTHEHGTLSNGARWTYFYADVRGLQDKLKEGRGI